MSVSPNVIGSALAAGALALRGLGQLATQGLRQDSSAPPEPASPARESKPEALIEAVRELEASIIPRLEELGVQVEPGFLQITGPGKLAAREGHPEQGLIEHLLSADPETIARVREIENRAAGRGSRIDLSV